MAKNKKPGKSAPKYVYNAPHKANVPDEKLWSPKEVKAVLMAMADTAESMTKGLREFPFNSEARLDAADFLNHLKSAKKKLEKQTMGGEEMTMPDLEEGEEKEYLEPGAEIPEDKPKPDKNAGMDSQLKLQHVMGTIQSLLEMHDVGASVILHCDRKPGEPDYAGETMLYLTPTYSILSWIRDDDGAPIGVYIRAKAEDFGGNKAARDHNINATASMVGMLLELTARQFQTLELINEQMENNLEIKHTPMRHMPNRPTDD
jgi:hypothetical protein